MMEKTATINVRVDGEDKRSTELLLKQVSLSVSHYTDSIEIPDNSQIIQYPFLTA